MRAEISVMNSGESLQESFNITVYTIIDGENASWALFTSKIASGQGIIKRVAVTVPEEIGIIGHCRRGPENMGIE